MHWSDLERGQPRLAAIGQERLIAPGASATVAGAPEPFTDLISPASA